MADSKENYLINEILRVKGIRGLDVYSFSVTLIVIFVVFFQAAEYCIENNSAVSSSLNLIKNIM